MDLKNFPDEMDLYFRRDIHLNQKITFKQPTIGQVIEFGEAKYFNMAKSLVTIPSDIKPELQDIGIDYEQISDFELFAMLVSTFTPADTGLLLGDLDFSKFEWGVNPENDEKMMYDPTTDTIIDRRIHSFIVKYVCALHGFELKVEHAANKFTKKIMIEDDRMRKKMAAEKPFESLMVPLLSSLLNSPEFKYDSSHVLDIGIYELFDSVKRITWIRQTNALRNGLYSGWLKSDNIKKTDLDWTKRL